MGHECAGEIVGIASDVKDWAVGDRIAIKPGLPCLTYDPQAPVDLDGVSR